MNHDFIPTLWMTIPFVITLLSIAIIPLIAPHFWEKNRNKTIVIVLISIAPFFGLLIRAPQELAHSLLEYSQFIILLGSLFIVSGGVALTGDIRATPLVNTLFLAIGAVIANIFGTTGASMLLIRPFLKANSERHKIFHQVPFFIFIVSNMGGLLTPIGDPPLFLGYLRGVPFFWTLKLFPFWVLGNGLLLLTFYILDSRAYRQESRKDIKRDMSQIEPLRMKGKRNLIILLGILYGVFMPSPWRELIMIHMAMLSLWVTPKSVHRFNHFSWRPIQEVVILFAGIFITMVPALALLKMHGAEFGISEPWHFFWLTGSLSSLLDNAPTYLTFFSLAQGLGGEADVAGISNITLMAISLGAVMMGANTYVGNGPNFMVKSIADHRGVKTPSFFGYIKYVAMFLIPIYMIVTILLHTLY